jgi:soluble lytic murein transglycosylase-like protein
MKKLIMILCILATCTLAGYAPGNKVLTIAKSAPIEPFKTLSLAVAMVESGNNPTAYNPKENAIGLYQIREIRIKDYNLKTGKGYKLKEMYDPIKSKSVFMYYAMEIGADNPEKIIRCWNGGDKGMKKRSTIAYYKKVQKEMAKY